MVNFMTLRKAIVEGPLWVFGPFIIFKEALFDVIHMADFRLKGNFVPKSSNIAIKNFTIHRLLELFL